jgi:hypothetical protein
MMTKLIVDIVASSGLAMAIPLKRRSLTESTFPETGSGYLRNWS